MRRTAAAAAITAFCVVLTGCAGATSQRETVTITTYVPHPDDLADGESNAAAPAPEPIGDGNLSARRTALSEILDSLGPYSADPSSRFAPDGTYSYAIVEASGDNEPDMAVKVNAPEFSRVYLATAPAGETPVLGTSYLVHGAAGVGGSRSWVSASNSGQGLWETVGQSVQPMSTSKLYAPEGKTLVPTGREITTRGLGEDQYEIQWIDSTDRSGLASLGVAPAQPPAAAVSPATPAGTQFAGTVLALSTAEVMNGEPAPNGESASNIYYVLQLDAPTPITAMQPGGDTVTRTKDQLSLGEHSKYQRSALPRRAQQVPR
ncbi:hypothetical protein [Corynebacterium sanguinis]|uniref:hypothetical protein n=1 Tax=Corynebacterium sanguinis TaxID=2594913 RepID=UPI0011AAC0D0|nr:hypothetical protein [Corynebacterium sanguinis]MCT1425855.1 hypothetical protein [Corynebacterium sanguinis]MCT1463824.1 hypothetical protein [Corynebacterium sanguinis]MCT1498938.1 hypothetical protein [Corynebacterium sanguinis]MCT1597375.1 hypothetical protein [Corynebacterium sanguinis]MCT2252251.1 hypothetical protein [Corynebacterium sanguinis]